MRTPAAGAAEADLVLAEPKSVIDVPDVPGVLIAAGITAFLLRATRTNTWAELCDAVDGGDLGVASRLADFHLDDKQLSVLDDWVDVIDLVCIEPPRTVAVCEVCGLWMLVGRRDVPSGCRLTIGCTGKMIKTPRGRKGPFVLAPGQRDPVAQPCPAPVADKDLAPLAPAAPTGGQASGAAVVVEEMFGLVGDPAPARFGIHASCDPSTAPIPDRSSVPKPSDGETQVDTGNDETMDGDFPL